MIGDKARKKNRHEGKLMFIIFTPLALLCLSYFALGFAPMETEYQYDIKAEQVYDNDRINDAVQISDLSEDERTVLHDAFKKSDHFFGGSSSVTIEQEEKLNTFDGWKVIKSSGVYVVVAIDGPETVTHPENEFVSFSITVLAALFASISLIGLKEVLFPSHVRSRI